VLNLDRNCAHGVMELILCRASWESCLPLMLVPQPTDTESRIAAVPGTVHGTLQSRRLFGMRALSRCEPPAATKRVK
jgi:hypothetical protein